MESKSHLTFHTNGSKLPEIVKSNAKWISNAASTPNAIEGDPTLFIRASGQEISDYFGYKYIGENTLQVPNVSFFNGQIQKLNSLLEENKKISLSFYETLSGVESPEKYLRNFVSNISLPIAKEGTVAIHDTTYLYGGIFFPQSCLVSGLIQSELILQFIELLESENFLRKYIVEETVLNIDSALGNFSYSYLDRSEKLKAYWILSREGRSGKEYVNWFVRAVCKKYEIEIPNSILDQFNDLNFSGVQKIDLFVSTSDFYTITDSRVRDFTECLKK